MSAFPQLADIELVLANGCIRTGSLADRCEAAVDGGFSAIGWSWRNYGRAIAAGHSPAEQARTVADSGLRLIEIETITGFADPDPTRRDLLGRARHVSEEGRRLVFEMADTFGARHVQVVGSFVDPLEPNVVDAFAALCDDAGEHGLRVALEFVPCTNIPDAATALRIVEDANRANGGLCVDIWHHERGARDLDQIAAIPAERIVMIQLDDGPLKPRDPDFVTDTTRYRDLPGSGEFDIESFLRTLWRTGSRAPISVEVMSDDLYELPPDEAVRRIARATMASLTAALTP